MKSLLVLAAVEVPHPGGGTAPPGSEHLLEILKWTAWGVFALCVAAVLISAAKLAHSHNQGYGGGNQQTSSLVWSLIASVVAGSAASIVGTLG